MIITQNTSLSYKEARGLAKCLKAYARDFASEDIMEIGFNEQTGYVYIALEFDAIQIASAFGQEVEYIYTDFETGEEFFYDSLEDLEREHNCTLDV